MEIKLSSEPDEFPNLSLASGKAEIKSQEEVP